jgi:hypothetical protein
MVSKGNFNGKEREKEQKLETIPRKESRCYNTILAPLRKIAQFLFTISTCGPSWMILMTCKILHLWKPLTPPIEAHGCPTKKETGGGEKKNYSYLKSMGIIIL